MPEDSTHADSTHADAAARVVAAAVKLATALASEGCEYAIGGALALGSWTTPRGTLDVDVTLFLSPDQPTECVRLLQRIGCELDSQQAVSKLREDGYCRVEYEGRTVDVFLPIADFYDHARQRRKRVPMGGTEVYIWDAETLCVFKMMFFRRKDLADVESILQSLGAQLNRTWIEERLVEMFGERDPRISQWREVAAENPPPP